MKTWGIEVNATIAAALEVIAGEYGNGEERRRALRAEAYDPDRVQAAVNDLMAVFAKYEDG